MYGIEGIELVNAKPKSAGPSIDRWYHAVMTATGTINDAANEDTTNQLNREVETRSWPANSTKDRTACSGHWPKMNIAQSSTEVAPPLMSNAALTIVIHTILTAITSVTIARRGCLDTTG